MNLARKIHAWKVAKGLAVFVLVAVLIQLTLGASPFVLIVCSISIAAGLYGFAALGAYNLGAWIIFFYMAGNVLIALFFKTLLTQPLDSNLYAPLDSFIAITITTISLLAALLLVNRVGVGRPIFKPCSNLRFLSFLSWACFIIGGLFWVISNRLFISGGFGGLVIFRDLLLMAVISRTAMLMEQSEGRKSLDIYLAFILITCIAVGLIDNSKTAAALPVVSYLTTTMFYGRRIPIRTIAVLVIGILIFSIIVAPTVHVIREIKGSEVTIEKSVELIVSTVTNLWEGNQKLEDFQDIEKDQFSRYYYSYFGGSGANQIIVGRFAAVQMIDPVIYAANEKGLRGGEALWPGLLRLLPRFIYPDKPEHLESYHTLVYYRYIHPAGGKFPTLPLAGQAYASYGYIGLMTIPFFTFLGFLLVIKKLGWQLHRNVYAIFFFCSFVVVYTNQGDFGQFMSAILRNFPLLGFAFWFISLASRVRVNHQASPKQVTRQANRQTTTPLKTMKNFS